MIQDLVSGKLGDHSNQSPGSPNPALELGRDNINVNKERHEQDQHSLLWQLLAKISTSISTGLESIFYFVYCDVSR